MKTYSLTLVVLAGLARAVTHIVEAGNLYFAPNSTTAAVGDVVEFTFLPKNHSVAAGDYDNPCQLSNSGSKFFSGYVPVTTGESRTVFRVTINDTDPIWLYCTQGDHCRGGMVGVINPPSTTSSTTTKTNGTQSLAHYAAAAANFSDVAGEGAFMYGGTLSTITNITTDATGTAASATSSSTSASGAADGALRVAPVGAVVAGALGLAAWGMA